MLGDARVETRIAPAAGMRGGRLGDCLCPKAAHDLRATRMAPCRGEPNTTYDRRTASAGARCLALSQRVVIPQPSCKHAVDGELRNQDMSPDSQMSVATTPVISNPARADSRSQPSGRLHDDGGRPCDGRFAASRVEQRAVVAPAQQVARSFAQAASHDLVRRDHLLHHVGRRGLGAVTKGALVFGP